MTPDMRLPYAFARQHGVLLEQGEGGPVCVARPAAPLSALAEVRRLAGPALRLAPVAQADFDTRLAQAYRDNASDASDAAGDDDDLASLADTAAVVDDLLDQSGDAPVVRLINALLLEAIRENASDIHIETQEKRLVVRFRIDGILRQMVEPKRALAPLLVSRIKVMARLDIAEKRLPQDGRVSLRVGGHEVDVRVSTIPSQYGERVVMRLLDRDQTRLGLDRLGMSPRDGAVFARLLARPDGMLLVTGPTGSGKTTSLYAALDHLNDRTRNIMTVEDPIEYSVDGIGQMQVNARTDLTFARGLRAILRQDPDVIMVGEIRDRETAQIAVESAMTGHFVLSTLHTNTAIGAVSRLIDMGVERFLLAPMLIGVVAQRLVRRLCTDCRRPEPATQADAALIDGLAVGETVFRATGCASCHGQGYRGRAGIYEVIAITRDLETLIHQGASEADLTDAARRDGPGLVTDGLRQIRAGLTTIEDVARVVQEV
ncbi:type II secretion system protein GspE [Paracoccus liaowanqingii]|uniref:Type II secretion system protein E n=2 Tax=Paracoccus liaowanqingii TaxID=2560053 RepID=A0A4Z1CRF8_9RHOB|nr:type II secretion system protein GspE [Paracoccus liaowanqingii]TGN67551.1 type II secretion system protein GspE [Paracoccus liaowanqingii]